MASLHLYPVKGCRGIDVHQVDVLAGGFLHDRRFMVLGADGAFVTQREQPALALVETAIDGDRLVLRAGERSAVLALEGHRGPSRRVKVFDDETDAIDVGGDAARFFSDHLGTSASLVYMAPETIRPVEPEYALPGDHVGFADGFPILLATLASLADLNAKLLASGATPVPIDRFRANIVVDGGEAYVEEKAARAKIGALMVRTPKPCARCQVVTVDQKTGEKSKEPLRTLAKYRSVKNKVNFAMNAIPDLPPNERVTIAVGDIVTFA